MKNTKISILRIVLVFLRLKEIFLHSLWSLFKTDNILITTTLWTTKEIQQHVLDLMTLNLCRDNISFEPYLREYNNIPFNWPKENAKKKGCKSKKDHFIHILGVHTRLIDVSAEKGFIYSKLGTLATVHLIQGRNMHFINFISVFYQYNNMDITVRFEAKICQVLQICW